MSGVYYASVPKVISDDDESHAGWLEFGTPDCDMPAGCELKVSAVAPESWNGGHVPFLFFPPYNPLSRCWRTYWSCFRRIPRAVGISADADSGSNCLRRCTGKHGGVNCDVRVFLYRKTGRRLENAAGLAFPADANPATLGNGKGDQDGVTNRTETASRRGAGAG